MKLEDIDLSGDLAFRLGNEAMQDKFGRGTLTVHEATDGPTDTSFELLVTPEYGESAQAQRYRVTVELVK